MLPHEPVVLVRVRGVEMRADPFVGVVEAQHRSAAVGVLCEEARSLLSPAVPPELVVLRLTCGVEVIPAVPVVETVDCPARGGYSDRKSVV